LFALKKVTKKRHPLLGPVKRGALVTGFFCGRRHKLIPIRRDSNMRRLQVPKKTYSFGTVKMGARLITNKFYQLFIV
jgi:hypothetical protein